MQRLLAIILLICLHAQPAVNTYIWGNYLANHKYIKEVLCINKEKPKMQCNGKCYLMQQLKKSEPVQDDNLPLIIINNLKQVFLSKKKETQRNLFIIPKKVPPTYYVESHYTQCIFDVFHPPQV